MQLYFNSSNKDCFTKAVLTDYGIGYINEKIESLKRINSIREANGSFDSCKRLVPSRLQELVESNPAVYMTYMSQNFGLFPYRILTSEFVANVLEIGGSYFAIDLQIFCFQTYY